LTEHIDVDEAKAHAGRAGSEARKAVKAVAGPIAENVADEARDTADKLEDTAQGVLSKISSDTGVGILALSVAIYAGAVAYSKFSQVLASE
jgi:hypothetical protein